MGRMGTFAASGALIALAFVALLACNDGAKDGAPAATATSAGPPPTPTLPPATTPAAPGSTGEIDPCALVTKDEAAAALGEDVQDGLTTYVGTQIFGAVMAELAHCTFATTASDQTIAFDLRMVSPENVREVQNVAGVVCAESEAIDNLGETACWFDPSHVELRVAKGRSLLILMSTRTSDEGAGLRALAGQAVERLP